MFKKYSGRLINFRPIVILCLVSVLSIFLSILATISIWFVLFPTISLILSIIILFITKKSLKTINFLLVFLLIFSLFSFRVLSIIDRKDQTALIKETEILMRAKVEEITQIDSGNFAVTLKIENAQELKSGSKVLVYLTEEVNRGDTLTIIADFKSITPKLNNLDSFISPIDYKSSSYVRIIKVEEYSDFFNATYYGIRQILLNNMSKQNASILLGLLVGDKSFIEEQTLKQFNLAGIGHIFAVSGLHIGFLAVIISFILDKLGIRSLKKSIVLLIILLLYCGICGWSLSSIRALIMTMVLSLSKIGGKKYDMLNSVAISVIIILFLMPSSIFDYGFLLSVGAVSGIALHQNKFKQAFSPYLLSPIASSLAVSLSAFLGTLPIILLLTAYASIISVFLNILVIPLVSIIYYIALFSVIVVAIFSKLAPLLIIPAGLIQIIVNIIRAVNFERFLFFGNPSTSAVLYYYLTLALFSDKVNLKERFKFIITCFIFCLVVLFN